jgi:hypothetical protein
VKIGSKDGLKKTPNLSDRSAERQYENGIAARKGVSLKRLPKANPLMVGGSKPRTTLADGLAQSRSMNV